MAGSFTWASGLCRLDRFGDRPPTEYALWGYLETDGEVEAKIYGVYDRQKDEVAWDSSIITP